MVSISPPRLGRFRPPARETDMAVSGVLVVTAGGGVLLASSGQSPGLPLWTSGSAQDSSARRVTSARRVGGSPAVEPVGHCKTFGFYCKGSRSHGKVLSRGRPWPDWVGNGLYQGEGWQCPLGCLCKDYSALPQTHVYSCERAPGVLCPARTRQTRACRR